MRTLADPVGITSLLTDYSLTTQLLLSDYSTTTQLASAPQRSVPGRELTQAN